MECHGFSHPSDEAYHVGARKPIKASSKFTSTRNQSEPSILLSKLNTGFKSKQNSIE